MNDQQPALLELSHVTKAFKQVLALNDLSLQVRRGAVHAIVGEPGAGKTTLLKLLGGFVRAGDYTGQVLFDGKPIKFQTPVDALRAGIAIIPRKVAVMENCTVADNIALGSWQVRRSFWVSHAADHARSQALLDAWSIDIDLAASVRSLGPLQRRLLMIARGLAINPKLVVLDEPLTEVAGFHAPAQLLRFVRRIAEHGLACLYLTAQVDDALVAANSITVLRDGAVAGAWHGPGFDGSAIAAALPGSRGDHMAAAADDFGEPSGPFGALNDYFGRLMRPVE